MDERYLRFPRWLEFSGLPQLLAEQTGLAGWLLFRRLVETDVGTNLIPDWVDLDLRSIVITSGLSAHEVQDCFQQLTRLQLLRARCYSHEPPVYQFRVANPLPVPLAAETIQQRLREAHLPDQPELWRYWEEDAAQTKYDRILRLYESTCGLRISPRVVEDLVELAEQYPFTILEKGFAEAREEGVTALGWIRKALKRIKKHERVQKNWGRPAGLELPEGFGRTEEKD